MNRRQILLINLLNRHQRFDSDARRLTLKDTDHCYVLLIFPLMNVSYVNFPVVLISGVGELGLIFETLD